VDWLQLLQSLGLPTTLLAVILLALGRAGVWAGRNLLQPLVTKHIEFLDKAIKANDAIAANQVALAASQAQITEALQNIHDRLDLIAKGGPRV
jgi:hypothetical protein